MRDGSSYRKVKGNLLAIFLGSCVKAGLLISTEPVGKGRSRGLSNQPSQQAVDNERKLHCWVGRSSRMDARRVVERGYL